MTKKSRDHRKLMRSVRTNLQFYHKSFLNEKWETLIYGYIKVAFPLIRIIDVECHWVDSVIVINYFGDEYPKSDIYHSVRQWLHEQRQAAAIVI